MKIEQAFILAGGEGSRLRPVTLEIPKPLVPVQGRPILTWQVRWLARHGIKRVTVIIPPKWSDQFEAWKKGFAERYLPAGEHPEIRLWTEPEPMGTLGALVHHFARELSSVPVLVTNGDELKAFDLDRFAEFHEAHSNDEAYGATIALLQVPNPSDYGVAEMEGPRIRAFHEKPAEPPSNLISSGLYLVNPSVLAEREHPSRFLMFEKDLFPHLAASGRLGGCELTGAWYDCGTMERWEKAIREWREDSTMPQK